MGIAEALDQASKSVNWSVTKIAAEAGVGEGTARRWLLGLREPRGSQLMTLRRVLPGFADLLDGTATMVDGKIVKLFNEVSA